AAIDYDEEDGLGADPQLFGACETLASELDEWLARPRIEPLRDGIKVVLAGPPNSGKSSLINAITGAEKAIVTDLPGTTRDLIEVPLSLGGVPILLTDTAGLREATELVEQIGVERTRTSMDTADVLVWLGEPELAPKHAHVIKVHARCDLSDRELVPVGSLRVSAVTEEGIGELLQRVAAQAAQLLPVEGALALNRRQAYAIEDAAGALHSVSVAPDLPIAADALRSARAAFDRLTGRAGMEDMLDALFGRFCLGK
ncbi:MAG: GTPase, partial [Sphingomicrobium sp.]